MRGQREGRAGSAWGGSGGEQDREPRRGAGRRTKRRGDWKPLGEGCDGAVGLAGASVGASVGAGHRLREHLSRPEERKPTQKRRGCAKVQNTGRGREGMNEPLEGVQHRAGQRACLRKEVAC